MNIQNGEVEGNPWRRDCNERNCQGRTCSLIDQASNGCAPSRRPVIGVPGQGVLLSQAQGELRRFAEGCKIPVSQSLLALGAFPTNSALALGFHGHTGNQIANRAIHEADLVVAIGSTA